MHLRRQITTFLFIATLIFSSTLFAFPQTTHAKLVFGGSAGTVIPCHNDVIWTNVSAPRGGKYIWAPGITRTYNYGPPNHSGQWLLGLYAAPYFCIVSPWPIIIFPGKLMVMLGSSV